MSHNYGSEDRQSRSLQDSTTSSAQYHGLEDSDMDDLVFSISLPSFNTLDLITPHRRNSSRGDWPPPTDAPYQPPPLRGVHPNFTRFTDGNTSGAQSTTENAGSGGFVSSRRTTPPRQLQNPPTAAANSRPRRILTAADFSGQYSPSPQSSSSESSSSGHSVQSSARSLIHLLPPFIPPPSSGPIPIPQANPPSNYPFTPQRPILPLRRPRRNRGTTTRNTATSY